MHAFAHMCSFARLPRSGPVLSPLCAPAPLRPLLSPCCAPVPLRPLHARLPQLRSRALISLRTPVPAQVPCSCPRCAPARYSRSSRTSAAGLSYRLAVLWMLAPIADAYISNARWLKLVLEPLLASATPACQHKPRLPCNKVRDVDAHDCRKQLADDVHHAEEKSPSPLTAKPLWQ